MNWGTTRIFFVAIIRRCFFRLYNIIQIKSLITKEMYFGIKDMKFLWYYEIFPSS